MLSKKMAFSLMSLITILAIALVGFSRDGASQGHAFGDDIRLAWRHYSESDSHDG